MERIEAPKWVTATSLCESALSRRVGGLGFGSRSNLIFDATESTVTSQRNGAAAPRLRRCARAWRARSLPLWCCHHEVAVFVGKGRGGGSLWSGAGP